jgi:DNA repair exonuclease SbcCD nuclease subunit
MKFLHAADVHIDSPLKGLSFDDAAAADRLRLATRDAFANVISLAIEERVDFVIIAGDLFDGAWQDMRTGLWTAEQFRRLRERGIRAYLLRGNHDAASIVRRAVSFPDNVREFPHGQPATFIDESTGAALHGQSFNEREESQNLARHYPAAVPGALNIGVLHTSLVGDCDHNTYAPTTVETLVARGYHSWALGHVHQRNIVRTDPHVVFPGNTQGRHIKETGAKGCYVVSVDSERHIDCAFHATDVARWQAIELTLARDDGEEALYEQLESRFASAQRNADGRPAIVRLTLRGACRAHAALAGAQTRGRILAEIRNRASDGDGALWLEQIDCRTRPVVDFDELRQGGDLLGQVLRSFEALRRDDASIHALAAHFQPLLAKVGDALDADDLHLEDPRCLRQLLEKAESLLVGELLGGEA